MSLVLLGSGDVLSNLLCSTHYCSLYKVQQPRHTGLRVVGWQFREYLFCAGTHRRFSTHARETPYQHPSHVRAPGMRRRMFEHGVQEKLWALAEKIARTVETPDHRKKREKAAEAATEAAASTDRSPTRASGTREPLLQELTTEDEALTPEGENEQGEGTSITLEAGQELDELAAKCVGAISLMLRSQETADALVGTKHHGLEILLELATVAQGRWGAHVFHNILFDAQNLQIVKSIRLCLVSSWFKHLCRTVVNSVKGRAARCHQHRSYRCEVFGHSGINLFPLCGTSF